MTVFTYDETTVSDLHKDARYHRPGEYFWARWNAATQQEKQEIWNGLIMELEYTNMREREEEALAVAKFEQAIADAIGVGAGDRETAIRWLFEGSNSEQDVEHAIYDYGILFAENGKYEREIKEVLDV